MKASQQINATEGQKTFRLACGKKYYFKNLFYKYLQLVTATLNVLEICKCILAQLE